MSSLEWLKQSNGWPDPAISYTRAAFLKHMELAKIYTSITESINWDPSFQTANCRNICSDKKMLIIVEWCTAQKWFLLSFIIFISLEIIPCTFFTLIKDFQGWYNQLYNVYLSVPVFLQSILLQLSDWNLRNSVFYWCYFTSCQRMSLQCIFAFKGMWFL